MGIEQSDIATVVELGLVESVFQPIVHLESGEVIGYEALARGPYGTNLERPDHLFKSAREVGLLAELDWVCRTAALRGALDAGLDDRSLLFINVEPDVPNSDAPEHLVPTWTEAAQKLRVVFEITEREATARPSDLVGNISRLRELGWGVALDDVGVDPRSLAMLPFIAADVVKLDMSLIQMSTSVEIAHTVHAVEAESERTGALVVAEGIEDHKTLSTALALGATLGQGWLFGRPGPLPIDRPQPNLRVDLPSVDVRPVTQTPFELVAGARPVRTGTKEVLLNMSLQLEEQALTLGEAPVVLSTFQEAARFTPTTADRYATIARKVALAAAFGVGIGESPAPGVRGTSLAATDPLREEWAVVVVGPHFAGAFAAKDLGDKGPDMDRRFRYSVTHDRELALQMARSLMLRMSSP